MKVIDSTKSHCFKHANTYNTKEENCVYCVQEGKVKLECPRCHILRYTECGLNCALYWKYS